MEIYQTEDQQVEVLRGFIKRNGKLIIAALVVLTLIIVGVRYWQKHVAAQEAEASNKYQQMVALQSKQDADGAKSIGEELIKKYAKTPYAQFAALTMAKDAVAAGDLNLAEEKLRWIIAQRSSKRVSLHVATERLARIMIQKGEADAALKLLNGFKADKAYISLFEEAKGDAYMAKNEVAEAKIAYLKAMQELPQGAQAPILQLKLLDLGVGVNNA